MSDKVSDILERAADRIEPEGRWTQKANARDEDGLSTSCRGEEATCWCMAGSVFREAGILDDEAYEALKAVLPPAPRIGFDRVVAFNDAPERTQAEVVAKLREAAAKAREQGK